MPLIARGRTLGAIQLGTVEPQPPLHEADVELATELARRASLALDNARLYREAQARAHAAPALEFVDDGVLPARRRRDHPALEPGGRADVPRQAGEGARPAGRELIPDWERVSARIHVASEPSAGARPAQTVPVDVQGEERWLSISAVRFPGGTVYAFRDLTEERAVDQLKSDFVATVSHELRTPLAAIYGAALTLQRNDVRLEESQRDGLLDVDRQRGRPARAHRERHPLGEPPRLGADGRLDRELRRGEARESGRRRAALARAGDVELVVEAPERPARRSRPIPDKLRQVLTNLVDNAVKYSPDGGRVRVARLARGQPHPLPRRGPRASGSRRPSRTRIFEKFFRLDPSMTRGVGGTGLGLYICRELVDRMHGRIWVASDGRSGSTFTVELPVA